MDMISEDKLRYIAGSKGFNLIYLEKDYFLTVFLYLVKDFKGIYLKGGTALNKIFLNHKRLSEDLDFVTKREIGELVKGLEAVIKNSDFFSRMEKDKSTKDFVRYMVYYRSYFKRGSYIIVDINRKGSVLLKPEKHKVPNFYGLDFETSTINLKELLAEKIRALITRNQPRDYFDVYFLLGKYEVDMDIVRKKLKEADETFDKERIFKNSRRIYSRWDSDINKLVNKKLEFIKCISLIKKKLP